MLGDDEFVYDEEESLEVVSEEEEGVEEVSLEMLEMALIMEELLISVDDGDGSADGFSVG